MPATIDNTLAFVFVRTASGITYGGQGRFISDHNVLMAQHVGVHNGSEGTEYIVQTMDGKSYTLPPEAAKFEYPVEQWFLNSSSPPVQFGQDLGVLSFSSAVSHSWVEIDPNFAGGQVDITTWRVDGVHHLTGQAKVHDPIDSMVSLSNLSESAIAGDSGSGLTHEGYNGVSQLVGTLTLAGLLDGVHNNSAAGPSLSGANYEWLQQAIAAGHTPAINRWEVSTQVDAFYKGVGIASGVPAADVPFWQAQADNGLTQAGTVQLGATVHSVQVAASRGMLGLDITWDKVAPLAAQLDQGASLASVEAQLLGGPEFHVVHGNVGASNSTLVPFVAENVLGQALSDGDAALYVREFDLHGAAEMLAALAANINVVGTLFPVNGASDLYLG